MLANPLSFLGVERQLTRMPQPVRGEFIEAMPIDPAFAVAIPAPARPGVMAAALTGTVFVRALAAVVTSTQLLAARVGPGGQLVPSPAT